MACEDIDTFFCYFLNKCGIPCKDSKHLDSVMFARDLLLSEQTYESIKNDIPTLRKFFSSSYMTSLQTNAEKNQRWPLINIVRQLLKRFNYKLKPIRKCNGYHKDKKKKFIRYFIIVKL